MKILSKHGQSYGGNHGKVKPKISDLDKRETIPPDEYEEKIEGKIEPGRRTV